MSIHFCDTTLALEKHSLRLWPKNSLLIPKSGASVALNKRALIREPAYVVSHLAVLVPGPFIDHEYLYFLSCTLDMMRLALDPAYPSLRTSDLARLRIPLPPLSEQRRIVEILQETEDIRRLRTEAQAKTSELIPASFAYLFGEEKMAKFETQKVSTLCELVRGSSPRPQGDPTLYGPGVPRLMVQDLTRDGWFVTPQVDSLTELGATKSRPMKAGDVVMAVSGAPGLPAILAVDCCIHDGFVGFRELNTRLHPIFFVGWLQQQRLRLEREAVGAIFRNLATPQIKEWQVPLPPMKLQEKFAAIVLEVSELSKPMSSLHPSKIQAHLIASLSAHAFSGQLTAEWRESHADDLAIEARERDAALKQAGAILTRTSRVTAPVEEEIEGKNETLKAELNREQRDLFEQITKLQNRKLKELGATKHSFWYFTAESLSQSVEGNLRRNRHTIEGHLGVFASCGLVIPVSREEQTKDTGEYVFGNAYRLPQKERTRGSSEESETASTSESGQPSDDEGWIGDYSRVRELERLVATLDKERALL